MPYRVPAPRPATTTADAADMGPADADRVSQQTYECDSCGAVTTGRPAGAGLFVWTRGDEVRYEEPPLCEKCARAITMGALSAWQAEDDGEE